MQIVNTAQAYGGDADLPAMVELINLVDEREGLDENNSVEDLQHWVSSPQVDKSKNIRLWRDSSGNLAALAVLRIPVPTEEVVDGWLYFRPHPDRPNPQLAREAVDWAEGRMCEYRDETAPGLPVDLYSGALDSYTTMRETLEENGFAIVRYFFVMHRPLDTPIDEPRFPDGFTLTNAVRNPDAERWVEMFNLSFIDHWGFHPATVERRRYRMSAPGYDPHGSLIALAPDGAFAAFCECQIDAENNARTGQNKGWIAVLGTRRGFRKLGLGRAMLLAGLRWLLGQGIGTAALDVDADNLTGALGLYESAGFHTVKTEVIYKKTVGCRG